MSNVIKNSKKSFAGMDLPLIVLIFFLLFSPPFIPKLNTAIIAAAVVFFDLIILHRKELKQTVLDSGIFKFVVVMVVFFLYVAVVTVINFFTGEFVQLMHYITLWYRYFLIVPLLMICCIYICIRCKQKNYSLYDLVMSYVYASMIQFVLVFIALVIPAVKAAFVAFIYKNTGDIYLGTPWTMQRRGFGFSNSFVDSFGFGMGIVAVLPLFFMKKTNAKIALFVPCLILISLVNVRTGLIMACIGLLFALPTVFRVLMESKLKVISSALASVILLGVFIGTVYVKNPTTLSWIFEDIVSFTGIQLEENTTEPVADTTLAVTETTTITTTETTTQVVTTESTTAPQTTVVDTTAPQTSAIYTTAAETTPQPTETITSNNIENDVTEPSTENSEGSGFWQTITTPTSKNNTAEILFSERFWNMPKGLALVFGTGHSIYGAEGYPNSDVGYVNDLWIAGIVGTLILYAAFALLFIKAFKCTDDKNVKALILFFVAAMLVFQIKANAIMFNAGINTILPLLFFIIYDKQSKKAIGDINA